MNTHITNLFKNGSNQAVRIPKDMAFSTKSVTMYREGERLIIEPVYEKMGLANLLASWQQANDSLSDAEKMPEISDELLPDTGIFGEPTDSSAS